MKFDKMKMEKLAPFNQNFKERKKEAKDQKKKKPMPFDNFRKK